MARCRCLVGVAVAMLLLATPVVRAQNSDQLAFEIINTKAPLAAADQKKIVDYVELWLGKLQNGADQEVTAAREMLLDPLRQGGSPEYFVSVYSPTVSSRLLNVLDSPRPLVDLNAMIVASRLVDGGTVTLIEKALQNTNPAVRYWAGKTAGQLGLGQRLTPDNETRVLTLLSAGVIKESSAPVLLSLLVGMSNLNIPDASTQLLGSLNDRLRLHLADPTLSPAPELRAVQEYFRKLASASGKAPPEQVRQSGRVLFRYLSAAATVLSADPPKVTKDQAVEYERIVETADLWLPWTARQLDESAKTPALMKDLVLAKRWNELLLRVEEWRGTLTKPPFGFTNADLTVK